MSRSRSHVTAHRSDEDAACNRALIISARRARVAQVSIDDGSTLTSFNHLLNRAKKVDFIEQFNEKLLVKQEGENLHIVDVHTLSPEMEHIRTDPKAQLPIRRTNETSQEVAQREERERSLS